MRNKFLPLALFAVLFTLLLPTAARAQGGQLLAAEYGEGGRRVDVTERVREFLHDGMLRLEVTDRVLGVDPARNHVKELFIRIRHWDGSVEEFRFPEHSHVNLEIEPEGGYERGGGERREGEQRREGEAPREGEDRGLRIMRAYYGGEGSFINVTDRIREMAREGRVFTRVDNAHMGVDPDPHVHKFLRVLYWFDGERRNVVVPEHGELRLP